MLTHSCNWDASQWNRLNSNENVIYFSRVDPFYSNCFPGNEESILDSSILLPLAHLDGIGEGVGDGPVAVQGDDAEVEDRGCRGQHICTQTGQLINSMDL